MREAQFVHEAGARLRGNKARLSLCGPSLRVSPEGNVCTPAECFLNGNFASPPPKNWGRFASPPERRLLLALFWFPCAGMNSVRFQRSKKKITL